MDANAKDMRPGVNLGMLGCGLGGALPPGLEAGITGSKTLKRTNNPDSIRAYRGSATGSLCPDLIPGPVGARAQRNPGAKI